MDDMGVCDYCHGEATLDWFGVPVCDPCYAEAEYETRCDECGEVGMIQVSLITGEVSWLCRCGNRWF